MWWGVKKGIEKARITDYHIVAEQEIPDWLIRIVFLREGETAIKSDIRSRFGIMGFRAQGMPFWAWVFSCTILLCIDVQDLGN